MKSEHLYPKWDVCVHCHSTSRDRENDQDDWGWMIPQQMGFKNEKWSIFMYQSMAGFVNPDGIVFYNDRIYNYNWKISMNEHLLDFGSVSTVTRADCEWNNIQWFYSGVRAYTTSSKCVCVSTRKCTSFCLLLRSFTRLQMFRGYETKKVQTLAKPCACSRNSFSFTFYIGNDEIHWWATSTMHICTEKKGKKRKPLCWCAIQSINILHSFHLNYTMH